MRIIQSKEQYDDEFHVIDLDGPVKLIFNKQIEDIMISSPDGEILFGWDYKDESEFTPMNAMLLKPHDNMKEISKERCTHFYMMPKPGAISSLRVYLAIQK